MYETDQMNERDSSKELPLSFGQWSSPLFHHDEKWVCLYASNMEGI